MRRLSLVMAFYKNGGMLERQYAHWRALPADLRAALQVVVCDDASPKGFRAAPPAEPLGLADFQLFRIEKKAPWNWIAARNVGVAHASGDWLVFTDMDHILPEATLRRLVEGPLDPKRVYRFSRVDAPDLTPYKPHPNSWLISRAVLARFVGFDERFSGCYGSDYDVRDRLKAIAGEPVMLPEALVRYPREVVADASTTDFERKQSEHAAALPAARARVQAEGGPPLILSYPFRRVA